jgi:hypothetical protein
MHDCADAPASGPSHHLVMTKTQHIRTTSGSEIARPSRRLRARLLVLALGLGVGGVTFGLSSSPGRIGGGGVSARQAEVAIPGIRGTGGGGAGLYGISTSPGSPHVTLR